MYKKILLLVASLIGFANLNFAQSDKMWQNKSPQSSLSIYGIFSLEKTSWVVGDKGLIMKSVDRKTTNR